VNGYEPREAEIDNDRLRALFAAGWDEYVNDGGPPQAELPDIDLGYTKLRATEAAWRAPDLYAVFGPPGVKITNSSDKPLVYETKGPYSGWGGPYNAQAGRRPRLPDRLPADFPPPRRQHVPDVHAPRRFAFGIPDQGPRDSGKSVQSPGTGRDPESRGRPAATGGKKIGGGDRSLDHNSIESAQNSDDYRNDFNRG